MGAPPDLTLHYFWVAPTVRPPYHNEFTILIGPGPQGNISYLPDYPNHNPPRWLEPLSITLDDLETLYALLVDKDAFRATWHVASPRPIGGEQAWIEVTAGDQHASIPSGLNPRDAAAARHIFDAVRALVPQPVWDRLESQRQEYIQNYSK